MGCIFLCIGIVIALIWALAFGAVIICLPLIYALIWCAYRSSRTYVSKGWKVLTISIGAITSGMMIFDIYSEQSDLAYIPYAIFFGYVVICLIGFLFIRIFSGKSEKAERPTKTISSKEQEYSAASERPSYAYSGSERANAAIAYAKSKAHQSPTPEPQLAVKQSEKPSYSYSGSERAKAAIAYAKSRTYQKNTMPPEPRFMDKGLILYPEERKSRALSAKLNKKIVVDTQFWNSMNLDFRCNLVTDYTLLQLNYEIKTLSGKHWNYSSPIRIKVNAYDAKNNLLHVNDTFVTSSELLGGKHTDYLYLEYDKVKNADYLEIYAYYEVY